MDFIIDFYKNLDTLNLIIFWGILTVIILLLIFSFILVNKNKKLKKIVEKNNKLEEDLPIKPNVDEKKLDEYQNQKEQEDTEISEKELSEEQNQPIKSIETTKEFIAEEHVIDYNNTKHDEKNINDNQIKKSHQSNEIIIPTKPYQRNVLREMSLSQTSPIGITRPIKKEEQKITEAVKDLEESLNDNQNRMPDLKEQPFVTTEKTIKKELNNIEHNHERKTEIISKYPKNDLYNKEQTTSRTTESEIASNRILNNNKETFRDNHSNDNQIKITINNNNELKHSTEAPKKNNISEYLISSQAKELLNSIKEPVLNKEKSSSEKYLEEVSKKLSEAEIPDEIERTDYELEQEENAIISYQELMEKKDSIQTIDEEDAVISIEELMNRKNNQNKVPEIDEQSKLYNITDEEENDEFINQLKQFRNDL